MIKLGEALKQARVKLQQTSSSPQIDAEALLMHVLNVSRTYLYSYSDKGLNPLQIQEFQDLITQRLQGQPIAYLTGRREFWSLDLEINEHALIPRPATEKLVEITLDQLKHQKHARVLDLGTGSGAIALALARERPDWTLLACDQSPNAVALARKNAARLNLSNVQFFVTDWFKGLPELKYHAIVSNPPYIAEGDPHLKEGDLLFEPLSALVSGKDGLSDLKKIIMDSQDHLLPEGFLLLEHGYDQKKAVESILKQSAYEKVQSWQDWEGNDRISGGQRKRA